MKWLGCELIPSSVRPRFSGRKGWSAPLQVANKLLSQVEEFKYLRDYLQLFWLVPMVDRGFWHFITYSGEGWGRRCGEGDVNVTDNVVPVMIFSHEFGICIQQPG